jgi:branched-chain amino acid aminotransferase
MSFTDVMTFDDLERKRVRFAHFEGRLTPLRDAKISILTQAFLFGTAVHEGIRFYYSPKRRQAYGFRLHDHYERLLQNGKILKISLRDPVETLVRHTLDVIRANEFREDSYVRAVAYKSGLQFGLRLAEANDFTLFAVPQGRFHGAAKPLSVCVSSWRRVEDNALPPRGKINGAYVNSALAMTEAIDDGYDDAILLNERGEVAEGTGMNLFLVRRGRVVTPSLDQNVLEGLTRDTAITLLREREGVEVESRPVDRTELYSADEVFFAGTGMEIVPVGAVDRRPVGSGEAPLTARLREHYDDLVRGRAESHGDWLTPVFED